MSAPLTLAQAQARLANLHASGQRGQIERTENDWYVVRVRCRSCGAFKVKGRCPVGKRDCGR